MFECELTKTQVIYYDENRPYTSLRSAAVFEPQYKKDGAPASSCLKSIFSKDCPGYYHNIQEWLPNCIYLEFTPA